jgi:hypothetical protein
MRVLRCVQKDIRRSTKIHYKLLISGPVCEALMNLPKACRMKLCVLNRWVGCACPATGVRFRRKLGTWHTPAFRGSQPTLRRDYTPLLQNATTPHALPRTEFGHAAFSLITHRPLIPPPLSPSVFKAPLRFLANSRYVKTTLRLSSATPLSGAHKRPGAS